MSVSRAFVLLSLLLATPAAAETGTVRRLALLVGVNDGGPERVRLRYAVSDAKSFDKVLGELGGVAAGDRRLLVESGRAELLAALGELRSRTEAARASGASRVEVLVYYSGHSDEEGLLLKGERLDYGELRRALESLPADVRIAVLDSCASGAFARAKGGTRRPAFLVDTGNKVRGHAILTSSSEDEASQESDRLGGSYFTHHLLSGLRGAADATRDGRVTLNEAYQFAFHETLARTEKTRGGAQHPAYDIELAGSGDLVMTDLRATSAGLYLTDALEGRLFVRDEAGTLVVELQKLPGRPTELGLAPGRYHVRRELDSGASEASFSLVEGQRTPLAPTNFQAVALEATVSRGNAPVAEVAAAAPGAAMGVEASRALVEAGAGRTRVPVAVSLVPPLSTNALRAPGQRVENQLALGLANGGAAVRGVAASLLANWYDEEAHGVLLSTGINVVGGRASGVLASVAGNVTRGGMEGMQMAAGLNVAGGDVRVGQMAAGANVATGSVWGVQLAAGANVAGGSFEGLQSSAGFNVARGDFLGLQAAAALNVAGGSLRGVQFSSGLNRANGVTGLQAALVNIGGDVTGLQMGLVNVAGVVSGVQLGLVNIAEEVKGAPIGLLSFEKKGQFHVEFWSSDIQLVNFGVKFGGKYMYTTLLGGIGPDDRMQRFNLGLGLGLHMPLWGDRLWLDGDLAASTVHPVRDPFGGSTNLLSQARVMLGVQLFDRFALFGGPTYNVYFAWSEAERYKLSTLPLREHRMSDTSTMQYWPGVQIGLRL
ncbi:caspase family protein [Vitiosangium sp. GDMCC 1.1324]|uniref:caspase family protein n=1 Tax=Vitiosangium sp. (strain GDMCC 1.1324) TaxID=2138576 RepID=UPI000D3C2E65|nr:caspase family protein [Vitiosangium sp. GDMCC 1.1324]PTL84822.1 peptidase [Vitiosangium sp. GDMCC 1.1324]